MADSDSENEGILTNIQRLVIRPPGHTGKAKKGHVCFDGGHETMNLGRVDFITDHEYDVFVRPDTANPRNRWGGYDFCLYYLVSTIIILGYSYTLVTLLIVVSTVQYCNHRICIYSYYIAIYCSTVVLKWKRMEITQLWPFCNRP